MKVFKYGKNLLCDAYILIRSTFGRTLREAGLQLQVKGSQATDDIAYLQPLNRHRNILSLYSQHPTIAKSAYIAPNATLIGDVFVGQNSYFGFGSVAHGQSSAVRVGNNTKIGQNTVLDNILWGPDDAFSLSVNIGNNVNIQQNCKLYSCYVDDNSHIGHGSVIMEGAQLERGCVISPNSTVPAGRIIPSNTMWSGNPVEFVKDLSLSDQQLGKNKEQVRLSID